MYEVIYCSRTGNTKKVAQAIASELGVEAKDIINNPVISEGSLVFIGTGNYGGKPIKPIVEFVAKNKLKLNKISLFGTSASGTGGEVVKLERLLAQSGLGVLTRFHCTGKFLFFRRHSPTDKELTSARDFARQTKTQYPDIVSTFKTN